MFQGDRDWLPSNLILVMVAQKLLRKSCHGYLAMVKDTSITQGSLEHILVLCEYFDIFSEELLGLPPWR